MWKTIEEFDKVDELHYRMGKLLINKTIKGKTYYKTN
jgi:hypothetical protein